MRLGKQQKTPPPPPPPPPQTATSMLLESFATEILREGNVKSHVKAKGAARRFCAEVVPVQSLHLDVHQNRYPPDMTIKKGRGRGLIFFHENQLTLKI